MLFYLSLPPFHFLYTIFCLLTFPFPLHPLPCLPLNFSISPFHHFHPLLALSVFPNSLFTPFPFLPFSLFHLTFSLFPSTLFVSLPLPLFLCSPIYPFIAFPLVIPLPFSPFPTVLRGCYPLQAGFKEQFLIKRDFTGV